MNYDNAQSEKSTITLELSINDVNLILTGLRELPHRMSDEVIKRFIENIQKQIPQVQQPNQQPNQQQNNFNLVSNK